MLLHLRRRNLDFLHTYIYTRRPLTSAKASAEILLSIYDYCNPLKVLSQNTIFGLKTVLLFMSRPNKKVCYCKHIACQHSCHKIWSGPARPGAWWTFFSHPVWSACKCLVNWTDRYCSESKPCQGKSDSSPLRLHVIYFVANLCDNTERSYS